MKLGRGIGRVVFLGGASLLVTSLLNPYSRVNPQIIEPSEEQPLEHIIEGPVIQDLLLPVEKEEFVFEAFQKLFPDDVAKAYFASLQAKEANNWYTQLDPGIYPVQINNEEVEEAKKNAGLNLEARATQQEYVLDYRISRDRFKENIIQAVKRVSGLSGKELFFALQELSIDKEGLDLESGIHFLYLDLENIKKQLNGHNSEIFETDTTNEEFKFLDKSKAKRVIDGYVTYYYTPKQSDFKSYRDFRNSVRMQGSGLLNNGNILRYHGGIERVKPGVNGITASGKNPIPIGTLAAPKNIKLRSITYVEFTDPDNPLSGWYRVDDRGSKIKGKHFDLFVGVGRDNLNKVYNVTNGNKNATFYVF